jgi:pimeloyl-ACP methyl ester carboxylesterase
LFKACPPVSDGPDTITQRESGTVAVVRAVVQATSALRRTQGRSTRAVIESEPIIVRNAKAFRYHSPLANHALIIDAVSFPSAPGFEGFAACYADQYGEIWCLDQTSESCLSREGCAQSMVAVAEQVAATGAAPPIFAVGVTAGGAAASRAVQRCPSLRGAVLIGPAHGDDAETSCQVKRNGATPPPTLRIIGGNDRRSVQVMPGALTDAELYVHDEQLVGLMNSPPGLGAVIYEWCSRQMNNHMNPRWWR